MGAAEIVPKNGINGITGITTVFVVVALQLCMGVWLVARRVWLQRKDKTNIIPQISKNRF